MTDANQSDAVVTTQQDTALLPVTQEDITFADKEAAATFYAARAFGRGKTAELADILRREAGGVIDPLVMLFARHRIAAEQAKPSASCEAGEVERVAIALCQSALAGKECPCAGSGNFNCADEYPGHQARAAITALRANAPEVKK